jgi:hypothetical protein
MLETLIFCHDRNLLLCCAGSLWFWKEDGNGENGANGRGQMAEGKWQMAEGGYSSSTTR